MSQNKIKVLMIGNHPSVKGGITSVISQILKHDWESEGVTLRFIPTYIEANNIKKILYFIIAYLKIFIQILFERPDVVYIHMSYRGSFQRKYIIHRLCKKFGIKDIVHLHGSEFKKWFYSLKSNQQKQVRNFLKECSSIIVLGLEWKNAISSIETEANIIVLSNTVEIKKDTVVWKNDKNKLLFLGVLIKRKGVGDLLEAVHILQKKNMFNGWKLIVAGTGEEEEILQVQTDKLGLNNLIEFTGWIDGEKKQELLRECQVLVLPSYNEGLPMAILEAMSYGMPVIATNVGDICSAVINEKNGYITEAGDVLALAEAIGKVIGDKDVWNIFSNASKVIIEEKFNEKNYFMDLMQIWENVS